MTSDAVNFMHRTQSVDFGVVLEGTIWAVLDSGEERELKAGDVCVQRGTNHVSLCLFNHCLTLRMEILR